jgi:3-deoxy-7-phosphoheptulonate synthase
MTFTPASVQKVTDTRVVSSLPLPSPAELAVELPRTEKQIEFVGQTRREIHDIIHRKDQRLMVVVGPCSIHDLKAGREYAAKLNKLAEELRDRMLILMRVYFEKPRTTTGWKGLIMDPHLNGTCDIPAGLRIARQFLGDVLDLGVPTATELLDPITPQYIADSLCWAAIGARTVESQTHRQMASGLSMPVGFKNSTAGDCEVAVNAIVAATSEQTFLGITHEGQASAVTTSGNPDCQIILRGGSGGPNYSAEHVAEAVGNAEKSGVSPSLMIDCSHGNSGKDPERQPLILEDIVKQVASGHDHIHSVMLESNLKGGSQQVPADLNELEYGVSITDGCLGWETTEKALRETHAVLAGRSQ